MSTHKLITQARSAQTFGAAVLAFTLVAGAALAEGPGLGKPITPSEIAPWDFHIMPDGTGLPAGNGTSVQGAPIFAQNDFSGEWAPVRNQDNSENPLIGDWSGIPLNEAGLATWVKADKNFTLLGTNELPGRTFATPAFLDGAMYLRTDEALYKFEQK